MTFSNLRLIGWEKDGKFYLSKFARVEPGDKERPVQGYDTQQLAIQAASKRGLVIEWQQPKP